MSYMYGTEKSGGERERERAGGRERKEEKKGERGLSFREAGVVGVIVLAAGGSPQAKILPLKKKTHLGGGSFPSLGGSVF